MGWFMWLIVFVVGSLILNVIINPSSLDVTKENIGAISTKVVASASNSESKSYRLVPSELPENKYWASTFKCSMIQSMGETQGISNPKGKECQFQCGKKNMDYSSNSCEKDNLICYCKLD